MAVLTSEYQYLGRSNNVGSQKGYNYYILLYAKTSGNASTGKHTVTAKTLLVCDVDSSFYGYCTTGDISINGTSAISWSWQMIPNVAWSDTLTEDGVTYARHVVLEEASVEVTASQTSTIDIPISAYWVLEDNGQTAGYFPYCGIEASLNVTATLPALSGVIYIHDGTNFNGYQCYIHNGSSWDLYLPYVYNGSDWELYSG